MSEPGDNKPENPGRVSRLDRLIRSMKDNKRRIEEEEMRYMDKKKNKYVIYKTPLIKVMSLPTEAARYKASAMGEPDVIPEDIELFIEMELERIRTESLE